MVSLIGTMSSKFTVFLKASPSITCDINTIAGELTLLEGGFWMYLEWGG